MKGETVMSSFTTSIPLIAPQPSRLPKSYVMSLIGSDTTQTPALRKSATFPLLVEENDHVGELPEKPNAKNPDVSDGDAKPQHQPSDDSSAQPNSATVAPEELALTELLEIISNRPSFHAFSKTAVTTPAYAEYSAIPRHHSSFEPRRIPKKGHIHSYSQGHINYPWTTNTDELDWGRADEVPADPIPSATPTGEGEAEEDAAEMLDALIADLHVARTPAVCTPISASPIPRTQNPMPLNSPFFGRRADDASQGTAVISPELYLSTKSNLVRELLARQKALNTNAGTGGKFVGVC